MLGDASEGIFATGRRIPTVGEQTFGKCRTQTNQGKKEAPMSNETHPNILLITTDQQRYDTLNVNGATWMKTANLDALANRGYNFHHAYVQNPVCIPSRACIQTGRYIHQHGVEHMEEVIDTTPGLPPGELTFMERLQTAGYHSAAFGKIHMMPEKGFHEMRLTGGKGSRWTHSAGQRIGPGPLGPEYAHWLESRHPGAYEMIYEQRRGPEYHKYHSAISNILPLEEYVDSWVAENTIEFIRREHETPFFVWCGFCSPHSPMDPPAPYDTLYDPKQIDLPANYSFNEDGTHRSTTPEQDAIARRFCAYYWGLVSLIDDKVGQIVAALEETDLLENTLVIYTSDHGEHLLEFGRTGKGTFHETIVRVPLIIVPPSGSRTYREIDDLVEVMDIAATVLDYASAEIPPTMTATSLRPLIENHGTGKDFVFCEFIPSDCSIRSMCIRTDRYKYIYHGRQRPEAFYDLLEDPHERTNRIDDSNCKQQIDECRLMMLDRLSQSSVTGWRER